MSVQISEVEVVPRANEGPQTPQQQQQPGPVQPHAVPPELEHEIARTLALLHARDARLRAD